ncbi:hypothetical protein [Laceyella putida]|uniref:Uncharacterized protein n=1 Tax=Laceyella putida TaxID=110101 RepID=A0ABW2RQQ5_9BACL
MAVHHGYEVGMQVMYTPEDNEFGDIIWGGRSYPAIITKIENGEMGEQIFHLVVFTERGVFLKNNAQPTTPGTSQTGRFSMTSNQLDKETAAEAFGLNYRLFRP